ncbi:MAG TPA: glutathione S-transferase family protein [Polyangiaceae bacterium]|jgi:putative glutathione S-transferase|nr:glutathione S-transferase family protein [Polyangiaceae bacterium]
MGKLIEGKWSNEWYQATPKGDFVRDETMFRNAVTADGSSGFRAEAGRYHLYVSLACPWAHRTLIARQLKGLQNAITVSVVHPHMAENGWEFGEFPGSTPDTLFGAKYLYEIYTRAKRDYTGRVTVPVLWDKQSATIVNNESRQILRMLDHEFGAFAEHAEANLCPGELASAIDAEIDALYMPVNNGVYRAGFAVRQGAYETAVHELFSALDGYEARLDGQRFLLGEQLSEADICFFTTLLRFDPVYHYHFKCNLRRIADYRALSGYLRDIYQTPGVAEVCNIEQIKHHYFTSHPTINPNKIIPLGPPLDLRAPHGRENLRK